ncbi:LOW QUALITY PROTEIN: hypothetical protein TBDG_00445, partial [Mycobacterium tuberculosis T92]
PASPRHSTTTPAGAIKNGLKFYEMTGFAKSNAAGIEATLAKLSDQYARGRA